MPDEQLKPSGFLRINNRKVLVTVCKENLSKLGFSKAQSEEALSRNQELLGCGKEMHRHVGPPGTGH